ncbi:DNA gyrase inhibitor YacG [Neoasaia chiangmaiensis]|uniref:DNA gyrase inhibitor YacG n=1 Tax=Neoasaia chiangmaiensis TaxID=320497 RepID=A0A1U9KS74_9PROT|nr:DNA gyrase inhibitor YacG [Neoasaia chiangmaiensis]AQS88683.1 hypothetical protein A0U93_13000 [Neoasaia chiangmaiensis]
MSICPICRRPSDPKYRPFCSRRCADVDLGNWFQGSYRVPSFRIDDDEIEIDEKTGLPRVDPGNGIG